MQIKVKKITFVALISLGLLSCGNDFGEITQANAAVNTITVRAALSSFALPRTAANFPEYVKVLKSFALANGINKKTVDEAFTDVYYLHRAIVADKNQPEKKLDLEQYLKIVASPERIELAKKKYEQYAEEVKKARDLTGVQPEYIIALWGIESRYGDLQGKEDVISALSTLAFEGRREEFFSKELLAALKILERGDISKANFKGSWAGAMGQSQFMPSSLLRYGKDGDGDGKVDIWNNIPDVLASIGNYLASVGWQNTPYWGNKVQLPVDFDKNLAGLTAAQGKRIAEWQGLGLTFADMRKVPPSHSTAWLIFPSKNKSEGYLVYPNFKTIMNWNRSYFFAISVGTIADSLREK